MTPDPKEEAQKPRGPGDERQQAATSALPTSGCISAGRDMRPACVGWNNCPFRFALVRENEELKAGLAGIRMILGGLGMAEPPAEPPCGIPDSSLPSRP